MEGEDTGGVLLGVCWLLTVVDLTDCGMCGVSPCRQGDGTGRTNWNDKEGVD